MKRYRRDSKKHQHTYLVSVCTEFQKKLGNELFSIFILKKRTYLVPNQMSFIEQSSNKIKNRSLLIWYPSDINNILFWFQTNIIDYTLER